MRKIGIVGVKNLALRMARNKARERGIVLHKFRQIAPYGDELGPEWIAFSIRTNHWMSVYFPIGEREIVQAQKDAAEVLWIGVPKVLAVFGGSVFLVETIKRPERKKRNPAAKR